MKTFLQSILLAAAFAIPATALADNVTVVDASDISNLATAENIKLTGTWDTDCFAELTVMLGKAGFPAQNAVLKSVDMSEAKIAAETSLYVSAGLFENGVFSNCSTLETVVMPTAEEAANFSNWKQAFMNCPNLQAIDLSGCSGLTTLNNAFFGCSNLKYADFSNSTLLTGVSSLRETFADCTALESVKAPATAVFAEGAFQNCTSLREIDWSLFEGTEAPVYYSTLFEGISDLKAIRLIVSESAYDLFAADANWSQLTIEKASSSSANRIDKTVDPILICGSTVHIAGTVYGIQISTASGKLIRSQAAASGSWDISMLPKGIYLLTCTKDGQKYTVKFRR